MLASKTFHFSVELPTALTQPDLARISVVSVMFPRKGSQRVDFDQSVRSIECEVQNLTHLQINSKFKVNTIWNEQKTMVAQILDQDVLLPPFEAKRFRIEEVKYSKGRVCRGAP